MERGTLSVFGEVHKLTETSMYKVYSRLGNGMLSALYLSTGGPLNQLLD